MSVSFPRRDGLFPEDHREVHNRTLLCSTCMESVPSVMNTSRIDGQTLKKNIQVKKKQISLDMRGGGGEWGCWWGGWCWELLSLGGCKWGWWVVIMTRFVDEERTSQRSKHGNVSKLSSFRSDVIFFYNISVRCRAVAGEKWYTVGDLIMKVKYNGCDYTVIIILCL